VNVNFSGKVILHMGDVGISDVTKVTVGRDGDGVQIGIESRDEPDSPFVDGSWVTLSREQVAALRELLKDPEDD
jgi:hypothetical protein